VERNERREHLAALAATPKRLKAALKGLRKKDLLWTPAPGKWSILEIVCHLRDMEREAYLARYRRILADERPTLPDIDGDQLALERDYRSASLTGVMREWRALRRETLALLRGVKADAWAREGVHATAGVLTIDALLRRQAVGNDDAHVRQIEAIRARLGLLARLEKGPAELARVLAGLSGEALRRRPDGDSWSIVEIVCHLRDVDTLFGERMTKAAFSAERPAFGTMDNERVAAALRYREADAAAALKEWRRRRADTLTLLRALPPPAWQRAGLHPTRGEITIERLAQILADHDARHTERVRELRGTAA
jgi:uncharacterized damage-inducible protein DinB